MEEQLNIPVNTAGIMTLDNKLNEKIRSLSKKQQELFNTFLIWVKHSAKNKSVSNASISNRCRYLSQVMYQSDNIIPKANHMEIHWLVNQRYY